MTPREGEVCALCGYPVAPDHELCEQCHAWQPIAREAEAAIAALMPPVEKAAA